MDNSAQDDQWETRKMFGQNPGGPGQGPATQGQGKFAQPQMAPMNPGEDAMKVNLENAEAVYIKQKVEMMEALVGWETENRYLVYNDQGTIFLEAQEESTFMARMCLGKNRPMDIIMTDGFNRPVMSLARPYVCCQRPNLEVYYPINRRLGNIRPEYICCPCPPSWEVTDASGNFLFAAEGPTCMNECCGDIEFPIVDHRNQLIGQITKKYAGYVQEMYTDADMFGLSFPKSLPLQHKVLLFSLTFMIDLMLFEEDPSDD